MAQSRPDPSNSPIFQLLMKIGKRARVEAITLAQYLNVKTVDDLAKYSAQYFKDQVGVTPSTIRNIETVLRDIYHTNLSTTYTPPQVQAAGTTQSQQASGQRRAGGAPPLSPYQQADYVSLDNFVE